MKSLLLIACSNRKVPLAGVVPALQRYDGGSYRVIRKLRRANLFPDQVDIKIISAKFGLIDALTPIPLYNLRMNFQRACELRPAIQRGLQELLAEIPYCEIYADLGVDYLTVLEDFVPQPKVQMVLANGRIGERLHKLKEWLASH